MRLKILGLIIAVLLLGSCNAVENDSTSGSRLQIVSLTGNDIQGKAGSATAYSDVITNGSIFDDPAVAEVEAQPLDPTLGATDVTPYMDVLVDQIDVEFRRTDGRNTEGVDVPYHFTQPMSIKVPITESVSIPFTLVRHVAKLEAPLFALRDAVNQGKVLQLVAVVTIHGTDGAGKRVAPVTGYLSVWCSDFADPTTTTSVQ
jgi:hypothetical protein